VPTHTIDEVAELVAAALGEHWQWMAELPDRIVFVADDADGWARLQREAAVLRLETLVWCQDIADRWQWRARRGGSGT
jgi:hypothetical protein